MSRIQQLKIKQPQGNTNIEINLMCVRKYSEQIWYQLDLMLDSSFFLMISFDNVKYFMNEINDTVTACVITYLHCNMCLNKYIWIWKCKLKQYVIVFDNIMLFSFTPANENIMTAHAQQLRTLAAVLEWRIETN